MWASEAVLVVHFPACLDLLHHVDALLAHGARVRGRTTHDQVAAHSTTVRWRDHFYREAAEPVLVGRAPDHAMLKVVRVVLVVVDHSRYQLRGSRRRGGAAGRGRDEDSLLGGGGRPGRGRTVLAAQLQPVTNNSIRAYSVTHFLFNRKQTFTKPFTLTETGY